MAANIERNCQINITGIEKNLTILTKDDNDGRIFLNKETHTGNTSRLRFRKDNDIVDGIYLTSVDEKNMNQIWNIGNKDNVTTINYLAQKVKEFTNSDSKIVWVNPKTIHGPLYEEAWDKIPDAEKIKKELGWKTTAAVNEIIKEVIEYYETN